MKPDAPQPRLPYTTTPTVPMVAPPQFAPPDPESLREVDARIARALIAVYAKRWGVTRAGELIKALAEKYTAS